VKIIQSKSSMLFRKTRRIHVFQSLVWNCSCFFPWGLARTCQLRREGEAAVFVYHLDEATRYNDGTNGTNIDGKCLWHKVTDLTDVIKSGKSNVTNIWLWWKLWKRWSMFCTLKVKLNKLYCLTAKFYKHIS